jgi:hypothetical protein
MPAPMRLTDVRNSAIRQGVSTNRFKISKDDAEKIRMAERHGPGEGLKTVLGILFKRSA